MLQHPPLVGRYVFGLVSCNKESAGRIARALVEQKLAARVQISAIDSVYTWDGEVQESLEFRLLTVSYTLPAAHSPRIHVYEVRLLVITNTATLQGNCCIS